MNRSTEVFKLNKPSALIVKEPPFRSLWFTALGMKIN